MLYPAGEWDESKTYERTSQSVPLVLYNEKYYYLVSSSSKGESPATIIENENEKVWEVFVQYEALYANFLMANWAMFGGKNGSIFYDKYLFSQKGFQKKNDIITGDGNISYNKIPNYNTSNGIFNSDNDLSGNFIPNLSLNFLTGEIVTTQLTEFSTRVTGNVIRMNSYLRNIIVTPRAFSHGDLDSYIRYEEAGSSGPYVILPQPKDLNNISINGGNRVSIYADYDEKYRAEMAEVGNSAGSSDDFINVFKNRIRSSSSTKGFRYTSSAFSIIAVEDYRGTYKKIYDELNNPDSNQWIIWNGFRSKFIFLSAGCSVRLKLVVKTNTNSTGNEYYWIVENTGDFELGDISIVTTSLVSEIPEDQYQYPTIPPISLITDGLKEKLIVESDGHESELSRTKSFSKNSTIFDKYCNWISTKASEANGKPFYEPKIIVSKNFCGFDDKFYTKTWFGQSYTAYNENCPEPEHLCVFMVQQELPPYGIYYRFVSLYRNNEGLDLKDNAASSTGRTWTTTLEPNSNVSPWATPKPDSGGSNTGGDDDGGSTGGDDDSTTTTSTTKKPSSSSSETTTTESPY